MYVPTLVIIHNTERIGVAIGLFAQQLDELGIRRLAFLVEKDEQREE